MPAYVIAEHDIHDVDHYETARPVAGEAIRHFGGRYLVNGKQQVDLIEGDAPPKRLVVLEFPDMASARAWYESSEYRPGRDIRHASATSRILLADGC